MNHKERQAKWQKTKKGKTCIKKSNDKNYIIAKNISKILKSNGCSKCGYDKSIRALQFHHVEPNDKIMTLDVSEIRRKSNEKIINEILKCVLLCSNCHGEIHDMEAT
jgi:ribosomal protein L37E